MSFHCTVCKRKKPGASTMFGKWNHRDFAVDLNKKMLIIKQDAQHIHERMIPLTVYLAL